MNQIYTPNTTFNQDSNIHSVYIPVLTVPGIKTNVSVSRLTSEIGQIAMTQAIALGGSHTIKVVGANDRFVVVELSINASVAGRFSFLDGVTPFVYGSMNVNEQFRYTFGRIGYLSTANGNDLVVRNETGAVCTFEITVSGYTMGLGGFLSRF